MKLLIGIPAYNEENKIEQVLNSLPKRIKGIEKIDILVVDDGSDDQTAKRARKSGVVVLKHLLNRGLGGALKTILSFAREKNYDVLVTCDADGQHDPMDIERVGSSVISGKYEVVIGTRWKEKSGAPLIRYIVNQCANILTFIIFGIWTSDSQSGLRAFGKRAIEVIDIRSDGMEVSSEFFKEIYRNKLNFTEVPIKAIYTDYSLEKGQKVGNSIQVFLQLLVKFIKQ